MIIAGIAKGKRIPEAYRIAGASFYWSGERYSTRHFNTGVTGRKILYAAPYYWTTEQCISYLLAQCAEQPCSPSQES